MRIYGEKYFRSDYFNNQIAASKKKFKYCKVSINSIIFWRHIIKKNNCRDIMGPIICMGTRNGREIDLFRIGFFSCTFRKIIVKLFEVWRYAFSSRLRIIESWNKSNIENIDEKSVIGVELNPDGKRKDVFIGSFDELPAEWENRFRIVYANTIDHALDPIKTAKEWYRVLSKSGYIIIGFPEEKDIPSLIDPVVNLSLEDIRQLFPGELIYYNKHGNPFREVIIQKKYD